MKTDRRRFIFGLATCSRPLNSSLSAAKSFDQHSTHNLVGEAFGTQWHLTVPASHAATRARVEIMHIVDTVNAALSPWRNDSEVTRFNRAHTLNWVPVSTLCSDVMTLALAVAHQSQGRFDPTVGPLVRQFCFGPIRGEYEPDFRQIESQPGALRKYRHSLTLDPCGIAKSYALGLVADTLLALGMSDYFFELGGEVRAEGRHPSGRRWIAEIESPLPDQIIPVCRLSIPGAHALATSGNRYNSYRLRGRHYSHIIDPFSAAPVDDALQSVTVIANSAVLADHGQRH
jgi:thiamine biosynthesis lipoprotein